MMRTFLGLCLLLLFGACTVPASFYLEPDQDFPGTLFHLKSYLQEEGWRLTENRQQADYLLSVEMTDWNSQCEPGALLLEREIYIPLQQLPAYREDISLEEIQADSSLVIYKMSGEPGVAPVPEGLLGIPVNGKTFDDPDYLLQRNFFLVVDSRQGRSTTSLQALLAGRFPPPRSGEKVLWLGAVGDLMLQRGVESTLYASAEGLAQVFNDTLPVLQQMDILCGNLEGAVTGVSIKQSKSYNFKFNSRVLGYLKQAGFDYLSLTNNHSFDYGLEGFTETLAHLKAAAIPTSGVGHNLAEALQPVILGAESAKVAIYSLGYYPQEQNGFDGKRETAATATRAGVLWADSENLALLKDKLDPGMTNVAIVHGGYEWESRPRPEYVALYRQLIEQSFQVVFAAHPHVLQGLELYRGGIIFYSLGNFIFPGMEAIPRAQESMIAAVGLYHNHPLYLRLTPVVLKSHQIFLAPRGSILDRYLNLPL